MKTQIRVWWPNHISSPNSPSQSNSLFGWFISASPSSLDVVVAFASDEFSISHSQPSLQEVLCHTNGKMPVLLQDRSAFSLLGQHQKVIVKEDEQIQHTANGNVCLQNGRSMLGENYGQCSCGSHGHDIKNGNWIHLIYDSPNSFSRRIYWIPKLHHIHWNGRIVSNSDAHVIVYETPKFGGHHFSPNFWSSADEVKTPLKKPSWVNELHQKHQLLDLDMVILAVNSASTAQMFLNGHLGRKTTSTRFPMISMFVAFIWHLLALSMASLSTLYHVILQILYAFVSYGSYSWIYFMSAKVFCHTWKNIRIRASQFLYWPVVLQDNGLRSRSSVEHAEKAALHKHSLWSNIAIDLLLGNIIGLALLFHSKSICDHVSNFITIITNDLLRSGCVWLMGVPAGFKLNMELAGVLGMISLNAIQIWSTLWFFVGFLFNYYIKGVAISGILFGATIPAALTIDMIAVVTLHLSTLHCLISVLYSKQIHALAALWRLFRGRKWNPLRQRLDSYDYTVEQHIVGSLLFTLLLLLLPTTLVFYIFFTIINTTISFVTMLIELNVSIIHATPFIKIFFWLLRRQRFPSGIWFEIMSCQCSTIDETSFSDESSHQRKDTSGETSSFLVSVLHSNYLNLGQLVLPHYRNVFCEVSASSIASSAYGVLAGSRIPLTLRAGLPSTPPWMNIPHKEYWCLCRDSILSCMSDSH